jgi:hypothetical protein
VQLRDLCRSDAFVLVLQQQWNGPVSQ